METTNTLKKELNDISKISNQSEFTTAYNKLIDKIALMRDSGSLNSEDIHEINHSLGTDFLNKTLQGHSLIKPYGYAGDFMIIDRIYQNEISSESAFEKFDSFYQKHSATQAVRNRKSYFKTLVKEKVASNKRFDILDIASGPARDLAELYDEHKSECEIQSVCVEMDQKAIEYARGLTRYHSEKITFIQRNICRFTSSENFDLIWAAGLFDYFKDKTFKFLVKRFIPYLKSGGQLVIGNFNENHNPTRNYMEVFGEWFLNHRSTDHLVSLAEESGCSPSQVSIEKESEGVNLFLVINN